MKLNFLSDSTIQLFSDILHGVRRNRLDGSRKKGGFKMHTMMDAFNGAVEFARITVAREHDQRFFTSSEAGS